MSALRPLLRAALPLAAASVGVFARPLSSDAKAKCTRWVVRNASLTAPRESPTPLVLLRTPGITWPQADPAANASWEDWADLFAQRGYTTVEVDVSTGADAVFAEAAAAAGKGTGGPTGDGEAASPITAASKALNAELRLLNIPFSPVIIASGPAALVAQAYVSDFPASGLVLVSPPPDADPRDAADQKAWAWPTFNYEPTFPILLLTSAQHEGAVLSSRVGQAAKDGTGRGARGVSLAVAPDVPRGNNAFYVSRAGVEWGDHTDARGRKSTAGWTRPGTKYSLDGMHVALCDEKCVEVECWAGSAGKVKEATHAGTTRAALQPPSRPPAHAEGYDSTSRRGGPVR